MTTEALPPRFAEILYDVSDGGATITLNRPARLNAVTRTMLAELRDALERADGDDGVRAMIVTGSGRAFCAGADLSAGGGRAKGRTKGRWRQNGRDRTRPGGRPPPGGRRALR